jgi:hypothetical protein
MSRPRLRDRIARAPLTVRSEIQHFALISHAVPAERVRARLPAGLELETFSGPEGEERAIISTACFRNAGFRPTLALAGGMNFEQLTFRTYVKYRGRTGAYFFGTLLSKRVPYLLEHLAAREAGLAKFHVNRVFHRKTGYTGYSALVRSAFGETFIRLRGTHPPKIDPLTQTLTHRLHGFFELTVGGSLGDQIVRHRRMSPWGGELIEGRFDFWERLGLLKPEEFNQAHAVCIEPSVVFHIYPPFPARLLVPPLKWLGEYGLQLLRG